MNENDDVLPDGNPSNLKNPSSLSKNKQQLTPRSYSPLSKAMKTRDLPSQLKIDRARKDLFASGSYDVISFKAHTQIFVLNQIELLQAAASSQGRSEPVIHSTAHPPNIHLEDNVTVRAFSPQNSSEIEIVLVLL